MIRTLLAALLLTAAFLGSVVGADALTNEDLYGHWVVDPKAATKEQADAVAAAKAVEGFGVTLTARFARVVFSADEMTAGLWRLDGAKADGATLVIQPKGGEERRFTLTLKNGRMTVAEMPGALPLERDKK